MLHGTILKRQRPAMGLRNLPAQDQADSRAALLGGKEGDKKVCGIRDSRTIVFHPHLNARVFSLPADAHPATRLERGIYCVVQQIDEQLFELIRIGLNLHLRPRPDLNGQTRLKAHHAANPASHIYRLEYRRRQLCQHPHHIALWGWERMLLDPEAVVDSGAVPVALCA